MLACALLAQSGFPSLNSHSLPPSTNDFWFVALGDNRPAGAGLPPTGTFQRLLKEVGTIGPTFVLSSGDLLYGNQETLAQYQQEIKWIKPLIAELPCPFFNAPGNHEINNRPEFLKAYTDAFGAPYGSFDFGGVRFVAICTELPAESPSIFGPQIDWLKTVLDGKQPEIVFEHHPVFPRQSNADKADAIVAQPDMVHQLYLKGGVKMVIEGHDHVYNAQVHDGIDYRIAGGAGAPFDAEPTDGGFHHFLLIHVKNGAIEPHLVASETLEIVPISDGTVAAADYSTMDIPVTNLVVNSTFKPSSVTADYSGKTGGPKSVDVQLIKTTQVGDHYETQVALTVLKAKAVFVRLAR